MTLSDLKWSSTVKSTSLASRAISAVAELLVRVVIDGTAVKVAVDTERPTSFMPLDRRFERDVVRRVCPF